MKIGVDIDGVCYMFVSALREHIRQTGGRVDLPQQTCWEFYEKDWGYTFEEFLELCNTGVDAGVVFGFGDPVPGSVETLRRLKDRGHTIHIVTSRAFGSPGSSERVTREWLELHGVPYDTLDFTSDKTIVRTDMFIDDYAANVDALRAAGTEAWLLLDQDPCGNVRDDQRDHLYQISTWADFEQKVIEREQREKMLLIGIGGYATAGKDALADGLEEHGAYRTYMSKPLEKALLTLNPWIPVGRKQWKKGTCPFRWTMPGKVMRYQELHALVGYDNSKNNHEVRRLLQTLGTEVGRAMFGEHVWIDLACKEVDEQLQSGRDVAITGIRFDSEIKAIRDRGGLAVWVNRPGIGPVNQHSSDNSLG